MEKFKSKVNLSIDGHSMGKSEIEWSVEFIYRSYGIASIRPSASPQEISFREDEEEAAYKNPMTLEKIDCIIETTGGDGAEIGLHVIGLEVDSKTKSAILYFASNAP